MTVFTITQKDTTWQTLNWGICFIQSLAIWELMILMVIIKPHAGLINSGDFVHLYSNLTYWSGTNCTISGQIRDAWVFNVQNGHQYDWYCSDFGKMGIAVHSGEVSFNDTTPVPEPTTILLFGTGLAGLAAFNKRRKGK